MTAPARATDAVQTIGMSLREMLLVIPSVFILLGLLDVWVSRERLMRFMGPGAGPRGTAIAFTRLAANIPAILLMSLILSRLIPEEKLAAIVPAE